MSNNIFTFVGKQPGPTVTIMGDVHGNEPSGVIAIAKLLPNFSIARGKVHLIIANLRAIEQNVRETDMNMNRAFKDESLFADRRQLESYERKRALEIMPYLDESEALLDIHSSSSEKSTPFSICEPHSFDIVSRLPFQIVSHGWDVIHPGGTDYYMNKKGGRGICIECGYHLDKDGPAMAENSIQAFLILMGLIDGDIPPKTPNQKIIYAHDIYHTKTNFKIARKFGDFEEIKKGEVIGVDGEIEVRALEDTVIIFARNVEGKGEAFVLAKIE